MELLIAVVPDFVIMVPFKVTPSAKVPSVTMAFMELILHPQQQLKVGLSRFNSVT